MRDAETALAVLAASRHGIVLRAKARQAGLSAREIDQRMRRELLVRMHEGVYRHAAAPSTPSGRLLAAVLASGDQAVASHRSAARLHALRGTPRWRPEVTVARTRLPRHAGIIVHRTNLLEPVDVTRSTASRSPPWPAPLLDLGAVVPFELVERATQDAIIRQLVSAVELICVLERVGTRGRRGTAALRATVRAGTAPKGIESHLELGFLRLIKACSLPTPVLQHQIVVDDGRRFRLTWPGRSYGSQWKPTVVCGTRPARSSSRACPA